MCLSVRSSAGLLNGNKEINGLVLLEVYLGPRKNPFNFVNDSDYDPDLDYDHGAAEVGSLVTAYYNH